VAFEKIEEGISSVAALDIAILNSLISRRLGEQRMSEIFRSIDWVKNILGWFVALCHGFVMSLPCPLTTWDARRAL
jgi:hypothetical protein